MGSILQSNKDQGHSSRTRAPGAETWDAEAPLHVANLRSHPSVFGSLELFYWLASLENVAA